MNKDEFYEGLKDFFDEQASISFSILKEDKVYQDLKKVLKEKDENFFNMLNELELDEEKEKIADDFVSSMHDCQFYGNIYQYIKGYKDCLKMLSYIGIFNDFSSFYEINEY